jgi:hypothetical protein
VDGLELREREMAAAAAEARARLQVATGWHRAADAELASLQRPVWGGVVDRWHRAAEAVAESAETVAAYEAFGPLD